MVGQPKTGGSEEVGIVRRKAGAGFVKGLTVKRDRAEALLEGGVDRDAGDGERGHPKRLAQFMGAGNDYGRWWISNITSTQFTVNVSADPGASNLDFGWRAVVL